MRVDWSTAKVKSSQESGQLHLEVNVVDVGHTAHYEEFEKATAALAAKQGTERRVIDRVMSTRNVWGIWVREIDVDDVPGERNRLDAFFAAIDQVATRRQAGLNAEHDEQQNKKAERIRQAEDLSAQFQRDARKV